MNEDSSLYIYCYLLIQQLNKLYIEDNYLKLIEFIYDNIGMDNISSKLASLLVFRSLLEASASEYIVEHLTKGFQSLLNLLNDSDPRIIKFTL